ncbi:hypothetical protein C0Q70_19194 [Pomacea canaliculata]|uniref:Uncharacterized protein n=1 Tax=Pomacea canaliculata TaxID=400727 RepID=A0A2T7NIP9_POMCA|nr:hypothetical protein C0Q70_19194 [Pomacea canaliculata]
MLARRRLGVQGESAELLLLPLVPFSRLDVALEAQLSRHAASQLRSRHAIHILYLQPVTLKITLTNRQQRFAHLLLPKETGDEESHRASLCDDVSDLAGLFRVKGHSLFAQMHGAVLDDPLDITGDDLVV